MVRVHLSCVIEGTNSSVNGEVVDELAALQNGDTITLGKLSQFCGVPVVELHHKELPILDEYGLVQYKPDKKMVVVKESGAIDELGRSSD
jgi:hypothetical protein